MAALVILPFALAGLVVIGAASALVALRTWAFLHSARPVRSFKRLSQVFTHGD